MVACFDVWLHDDFGDLQAGYQPKTTICSKEWSAKMIGADI